MLWACGPHASHPAGVPPGLGRPADGTGRPAVRTLENDVNYSRLPAVAAGFLAVCVASAAVAQDIEYTLLNSSSATLMEFYTSPVEDAEWGEDLLGDAVVAPGEGGTVTIADGEETCDYDMLFVFDDDTELTDTVDICELASYELLDQ